MRIFCLIIVLLFVVSSVTLAADPELEIEFYMSDEAALTVIEYRLHIEKDSITGIKDHIGTLPNGNQDTWRDVFYGIPMGKTLNYYLEAVDAEGDSGWSLPYPFKLTGRAKIISIRRVK